MDKFIHRFFSAPAGSFFIFGPRGTGKSTWLKKTFPDACLIDLLDDDTFRNYLARPERIRQIVQATPQTKTYIIDEIQKAPAMLDSIHALIEADRSYRFILTGSSARKLRRGGVNLLANRGPRWIAMMKSAGWRWKDWSCSISKPGAITGILRWNALFGDPAAVRKWISCCMGKIISAPSRLKTAHRFIRTVSDPSRHFGKIIRKPPGCCFIERVRENGCG